MKSLFRKIGKGLSNIGKAIGKVFNSKVGRVIGTLSMAAGMFGLFQVLAGGLAPTATVTTQMAGTGVEAAVAGGAGAGSAAASGTAASGSAAASSAVSNVASAASKTAVEGARIPINNAVETGYQIAETAKEAVANSNTLDFSSTISDATLKAIDAEAMGTSVLTDEQIFKYGEASLTGGPGTMQPVPSKTFSPSQQDLINLGSERSLAVDRATANYATQDLPGHDVFKEGLLDKYSTAAPSDVDMHVRMNQRDVVDQLKNREFREKYNIMAEKYPEMGYKPSEALAKQEFMSYADALEKGEGFFGKSQNVLQHTFESDLGSVTDGKFTGFGSDVKATTAVTTGASLLAPEPEMPEAPSRPNLYASSIASSQLDTAESLASAPTMSQTVQLNNSISNGANPMQTLNSIRSNAGYSQVYGPYFSMSA